MSVYCFINLIVVNDLLHATNRYYSSIDLFALNAAAFLIVLRLIYYIYIRTYHYCNSITSYCITLQARALEHCDVVCYLA